MIVIVKGSGKEAKKNKDLVYGLAALAVLASIDTAVDEKMAKEGLWDLVVGKDQPKVPLLLQPNFLGYNNTLSTSSPPTPPHNTTPLADSPNNVV